ncbi:DUF4255 domain-containing protein [Dapis sp. BLCC M229]|uniref:DUF4255 domain-containing protein n=1 Tax=Dapis sp. BLCC M229 TaxID=3400188 RepID=UPI003CEC8C72
MSNHLAIATVTAVLQRMLQTGVVDDVPGAQVTTLRPDNSGSGMPDVGVNIFLYQASPSPAWRNTDLRTRRPKENLIKHAQAGLDLFYLLSFYGNEQELEPQRLLGSAIQTVVDQPILTPEMIRSVTESSSFRFLADSTLDEQVQMVQFVPIQMNSEELSRIWSIFFQIPYILSFAFKATAVLIEGEKMGKASLPVRSRKFSTVLNRPSIDKFESSDGNKQSIIITKTLTIQGKQLLNENVRVQIGKARVTPQVVSDTEVKLDFSTLSSQEREPLKAGVQGLQIVHLKSIDSTSEPQRVIESNALPFILCPEIKIGDLEDLENLGDDFYSGKLTIYVDLIVEPTQRLFLLLNSLSSENLESLILPGKKRRQASHSIQFSLPKIKNGDYLVRVQIDGAESFLTVENNRYSGPLIHIP